MHIIEGKAPGCPFFGSDLLRVHQKWIDVSDGGPIFVPLISVLPSLYPLNCALKMSLETRICFRSSRSAKQRGISQRETRTPHAVDHIPVPLRTKLLHVSRSCQCGAG